MGCNNWFSLLLLNFIYLGASASKAISTIIVNVLFITIYYIPCNQVYVLTDFLIFCCLSQTFTVKTQLLSVFLEKRNACAVRWCFVETSFTEIFFLSLPPLLKSGVFVRFWNVHLF